MQGGPDDLRGDLSVRAASLSADQGAGQFVFTPAVVWIESGSTITWDIEDASHSVTAYHPSNDQPRRIPADASGFDSGVLDAGATYRRRFETPGVYNYYCTPHESLGMVGVVIVDAPGTGPGTAPIRDLSGAAAAHLERQLTDVAGLELSDTAEPARYGWEAATFDAYWYSLYNMSTNIAMSGNGMLFPSTDQQRSVFEQRLPAMLEAAGQDQLPVKNPNLNMAPFTSGDPHFTQQPVLSGPDGRPDAATLTWDPEGASGVVSPASLAWTHLKGVTWAKNFENHFDILPESLAAEFRSEMLSTLAQLGIKFALVDGNLRANEDNLQLVSGFAPGSGVTDPEPTIGQHSAMLWFLGDMVSLATGGWFGYENPEPLIPPSNIQMLADGLARTVMTVFPPDSIDNTRDIGMLLGSVGWYGTHSGSEELTTMAAEYATALADRIDAVLDGSGRVPNGVPNQAATQGVVTQGLVWASQIDGVDRTALADDAVGYLLDVLWDDAGNTFRSAADASTYTISARDAGDITGGLNAADVALDRTVRDRFARFFDATFNKGRLQRAERPPSRDTSAENPLPLPPQAGGEHGQAAVYNAEVEYDPAREIWTVTDDTFDTEQSLYLANQDIWVGQWGGRFFQGRGLPGASDTPE